MAKTSLQRAVIDLDTTKTNEHPPRSTGRQPSRGRAASSRRNGGTSQVPNRRLRIRDR